MKKDGMPFGSKGPEGGDKAEDAANELHGAKGGGMKHVVSPGAQSQGMNEDHKKHMLMMALMRAMQGGGAPGPAGPPMGGMPMGQPPMPPMGGGM